MQRLLLDELIKWRNRSSRLPLLLRGARQTGKTTIIRQLGEKYFDNIVEINFELEPDLKICFEDLEPKKITNQICTIKKQKINLGKTLLFLDEIQDCPKAIQALRYFKEKMPELHVIGAGSLLEFALNQADFRMPVGRVEYLYLYPMNFIEFLMACGEDQIIEYINTVTVNEPMPDAIHNRCLELLKYYTIVGGMPEIIKNYIKNEDFMRLQSLQLQLLANYRNDFGKYASKVYQGHCQTLFNKMPELVSKHFRYVNVDPSIDSRALKIALSLLQQAGLIYSVHETQLSGLPLNAHMNQKKFKLLLLDLGLIKAAGKIDPETILNNPLLDIRNGALAEQFVAQELISYEKSFDKAELFYWSRDKRGSQAEIDYIFVNKEQIIPIEVKAGKTGRMKSMQLCLESYNLDLGVKLSYAPLELHKKILSVPLYMINQIERLTSSG